MIRLQCTFIILIVIFTVTLAKENPDAPEIQETSVPWCFGKFIDKNILLGQPIQKHIFSPDNQSIVTGSIPLLYGWPVKSGKWPQFPVTADCDNDDKEEIVIGDKDGNFNLFNIEGNAFPGAWPKKLGNELSSPAIADINNDGIIEIIVVQRNYFKNFGVINGIVHVFEPDGSYFTGWPVELDGPHNWINNVSIGDINNDGTLDIITATGMSVGFGGNQDTTIYYKKIYAFNYDGSILDGWPVEPGGDVGLHLRPRSPILLVDLDHDGYQEVICGCLNWDDPNGGQNAIYAYRYDGTVLEGFPIITDNWNYSMAAADMDGDGEIEIFSHGDQYNRFGQKNPNWKPQKYVISKLAIADVNQDGYLELIYGTGGSGEVYVVDYEGNPMPGWPVYAGPSATIMDGNPIVGDIDGDGDVEIFIGGYQDNHLYGWYHDGSVVEGFPLITNGDNRRIAMSDLDNDGDMEMISACQDSFIYVWDCPGTMQSYTLEWPMFQHDERHSGFYDRSQTSVENEQYVLPAAFSLLQNYPNPFNSETTISYDLPVDSYVELTIYNIKGEKVKTLVDVQKRRGSHKVVWKGINQDGFIVSSGLYFVKFVSANHNEVIKITFMK